MSDQTAKRFEPIRFDKRGLSLHTLDYSDRIQRMNVDVAALAAELRREIRGEVRFDDGSRAIYSTDASNYRQVPIGVVLPLDVGEVERTVAIARRFGAPILGRGGGTSLAGQCCNVAVVVDMSKYMNRVESLDRTRHLAVVQPGAILDDLRRGAEKHHLTFGPDPATHNHCTFGGMIGNNSCGVHSVMSGRTSENIEELEVLTYDGVRLRVGATSEDELRRIILEGGRKGEIYRRLDALRSKYAELIRARFPRIPRRVSGYNLPELLPENGFNVARALVGSESTCVLVLEATVNLIDSPPERSLVVIGFPDIFVAADRVPEILQFGPIALEGVDDRLLDDVRRKGMHADAVKLLPAGKGWLLIEFGSQTKAEAKQKADRLVEHFRGDNGADPRFFEDQQQARMMWSIRESGLGATAYPDANLTWEGWEDSAVAPEKLGGYLRDLRKLFDKYEYRGDLYGHFGQGCVHTRNYFDLQSAEGIKKFRSFLEEASDLVISCGGSLSGEHGDGQSRADLLPKMFGTELMEAFREFKSIWDPEWKMNPGKIVQPYHIDENLRLGADYRPWTPPTHFRFPDDRGQISHAILRCVGVGECRRLDHGTMCPSFMATREEEHSTRGRARLLYEMFKGGIVPANWRRPEVKDALDLCLACKACKGECPVNVDMATYKAEFLSHYYARRLRPRAAYSMGLIHWWARAASIAPSVVNFVTAIPPLSALAKFAAGIAPQRKLPRFAKRTLRDRFRSTHSSGQRVILWPDTFTNYFHPRQGLAAVAVLESLGFSVVLPQRGLCCGRPLYDFGMLRPAKKLLRKILDELEPLIRQRVPLVGLEPSCIAVFRDELVNLFPNDERAKTLREHSFLLTEFLDRNAADRSWPKLHRRALVHGHCHQKSILGMSPVDRMLQKLEADYQVLDSGCCGMAGSFGFEKHHYDVSQRIGERVLLPAVRSAGSDVLIIADGFSCREQIVQGTGRQPVHMAEVLAGVMGYEIS